MAEKIAITYKDVNGNIRIKNCGNAESTRQCISWLKRKGFKFISKQAISTGNKPSRMRQTKKIFSVSKN